MGPPIFIGGNIYGIVATEAYQAASMGPPIFIGGNLDEGGNEISGELLQWGRRFSSAEMWSVPRPLRGAAHQCFNGAADFHRRKSR